MLAIHLRDGVPRLVEYIYETEQFRYVDKGRWMQILAQGGIDDESAIVPIRSGTTSEVARATAGPVLLSKEFDAELTP